MLAASTRQSVPTAHSSTISPAHPYSHPCISYVVAVFHRLSRWGSRGIGSPAGGRLPFILYSLSASHHQNEPGPNQVRTVPHPFAFLWRMGGMAQPSIHQERSASKSKACPERSRRGPALAIFDYSGSRIAVPRNLDAKWCFPQENATFHRGR